MWEAGEGGGLCGALGGSPSWGIPPPEAQLGRFWFWPHPVSTPALLFVQEALLWLWVLRTQGDPHGAGSARLHCAAGPALGPQGPWPPRCSEACHPAGDLLGPSQWLGGCVLSEFLVWAGWHDFSEGKRSCVCGRGRSSTGPVPAGLGSCPHTQTHRHTLIDTQTQV